jgi:hypothetical protein
MISGERRVGRIFRTAARRKTSLDVGAIVAPRLPSFGIAATLDEAKSGNGARGWIDAGDNGSNEHSESAMH